MASDDERREWLLSKWERFTDDELFGIYSIVSGNADRFDPKSPLAIMRNEAVTELERRRQTDADEKEATDG